MTGLDRAFAEASSLPAMSRAMAWAADLRLPRPVLRAVIRAYVRGFGVDLSDVALPIDRFPTLNAFFTRALRDGARPIALDPDVLVSPADALVHDAGPVPVSGRLDQVKGRRYGLGALLGDESEAAPFLRGVYATLYLSPRDYHRVHFPADGQVVRWRHLPGRLYPVNRPAVRSVDGLFAKNERITIHLETERFGPIAVVMVGAANVSRITLPFAPDPGPFRGRSPGLVVPREPIPVRRGDELGVFNLGSTVVLLAADRRLAPVRPLAGDHVVMGSELFRGA
jgi:phosphatidylserine decarboxylase